VRCGNWLYAGFQKNGYVPNGIKVLYNRASVDLSGLPREQQSDIIWWDGYKKKWRGKDVVDLPSEKENILPFWILKGRAKIFALLNSGPFPEYYPESILNLKNPLSPLNKNPFTKKKTIREHLLIFYRNFSLQGTGRFLELIPYLSEFSQEGILLVSKEFAKKYILKDKEQVFIYNKKKVPLKIKLDNRISFKKIFFLPVSFFKNYLPNEFTFFISCPDSLSIAVKHFPVNLKRG
jgi:hypothetical protein